MKPTDLQAAAEAGARAAAALLPPRPTDRGAVQAFGTRMRSYLKRRRGRRAATPAPEPTSQLTRMLLEYEALTANSPPPRKALADALYDISSEYTRAQAREVARTVREGYDNDKGVEKVASELKRRLGIEDAQANVLAQTELTRVAALDVLDQTRKAGSDEVMFVSHEDACPQCEALHGKVFPLKRAHDVLPVHPNCTCRFQPVGSTHNVFCPTGEGGGIDPTCKRGETGGIPPSVQIGTKLTREQALSHIVAHNPPEHIKSGALTKEEWADKYLSNEPGGYVVAWVHPRSMNAPVELGEPQKVEGFVGRSPDAAPPIVVDSNEKMQYRLGGGKIEQAYGLLPHVVVDGKHRTEAAVRRGDQRIKAVVPVRKAEEIRKASHNIELAEFAKSYADDKGHTITSITQTNLGPVVAAKTKEGYDRSWGPSDLAKIANKLGHKFNFQPVETTHNAFCPTGEGGGVDPTCGKGKKGGDKHVYEVKSSKPAVDATLKIKLPPDGRLKTITRGDVITVDGETISMIKYISDQATSAARSARLSASSVEGAREAVDAHAEAAAKHGAVVRRINDTLVRQKDFLNASPPAYRGELKRLKSEHLNAQLAHQKAVEEIIKTLPVYNKNK